MKILVCGDSYHVTDSRYPGLHWTEKLESLDSNLEIMNLSYGGCTNAMIAWQLLLGLNLKPNFVIFSFTSDSRYELDKDAKITLKDFSLNELKFYQENRYTTSVYKIDLSKKESILNWLKTAASPNFEKLKNYFFINFCLTYLQSQNIPFAFSLGGFLYKENYSSFIKENHFTDIMNQHATNQLAINLWNHGEKADPFFHVDDEKIQILYAQECFKRINQHR